MIICDEKHDKQTEGLPQLRLRGTTEVHGETVEIDCRLRVREKHFCKEHYVSLLKEIDFAAIANSARVKKDAPPE